jgi:hypothetical protein
VIPDHVAPSIVAPTADGNWHVTPISIKPSPPTDVVVTVESQYSLLVTWKEPANIGGDAIEKYKVEWYEDRGVQEIRVVTVNGYATGGTWTATLDGGGNTTPPMPHDVTRKDLEMHLERLAGAGNVAVQKTDVGTSATSHTYSITFLTYHRTDGANETAAVASFSVDATQILPSGGVNPGNVSSALNTSGTAYTNYCQGLKTTCGIVEGADLDIDGDTYHYIIGGKQGSGNPLTSGHDYIVRVSAVNTADEYGVPGPGFTGVTPYLASDLIERPRSIPSMPEWVTTQLVAGSSTSLKVYWKRPPTKTNGDNGATVTDYRVEWSTDINFAEGHSTTSFFEGSVGTFASDRLGLPDGGIFEYEVLGLKAGLEYQIRVAAINAYMPDQNYVDKYAGGGDETFPRTAALRNLAVAHNSSGSVGLGPFKVAEQAPSFGGADKVVQIVTAGAGYTTGTLSFGGEDKDCTKDPVGYFTVDGAGAITTTTISTQGDCTQHPTEVTPVSLTGSGATFEYTTGKAGFLVCKAADAIEYGRVLLNTVPADLVNPVKNSVQSLRVTWEEPHDMHGCTVDEYLIEWWATDLPNDPLNGDISRDGGVGVIEQQIISISGDTTTLAGTFQVSWNGDKTDHVPYNVSAEYLRRELEGLSTVQTVFVEEMDPFPSSSAGTDTYSWKVSFTSGAGNLSHELVVDSDGLAAATSVQVFTDGDSGSVAGALPAFYGSHTFVPSQGSRGMYDYVIRELVVGRPYFVRVSSHNFRGLAPPQYTTPTSLAPPIQKADVPINVLLINNSGASLKVVWNAPATTDGGKGRGDGGDVITKYKIEWDTVATFDGGTNGVATYSHETENVAGDCDPTPCFYIMRSLKQGTVYHVRVSSYNSYGYSANFAPSTPPSMAPRSSPSRVSGLAIAPSSSTSIRVTWNSPDDDGGAPITAYRIEWDAQNAAARMKEATRVLYNRQEVQEITTSATTNDISGTFRLQFESQATPECLMISLPMTSGMRWRVCQMWGLSW